MYLVLAPALAQTTTINYQSVGREISTVSNLHALESVEAKSEVIIFYDYSIELQKMLDLKYLLDIQFKVIVNNSHDFRLLEGIFPCHLIDYRNIDGALIRAIKLKDQTAMLNLQRSERDKLSMNFRPDYLLEVSTLMNAGSSNSQVKTLCASYQNLHSQFTEMSEKYLSMVEEHKGITSENFALKQSVRKFSADTRSFIRYFTGLQNRYRAITAMSVIRENAMITLPQHLITLHLKDYGIPNSFNLLAALYDSLTTFYHKHVKVVYIAEPDGLAINLIPKNYCLITNSVQHSDLLKNDYLACVGNVRTPLEYLINTSQFNTLVLCDARREADVLFTGENLFLNLAPDLHTVEALSLNEDITITPSSRSKYILREEVIAQNAAYGSRNAKLVTQIINTLLERRGEV